MGGIFTGGGSIYQTSNTNTGGGGGGGTGPQGPQGPAGENAPNVEIQYSVNNITLWHSVFTTGDLYIRFSVDGGDTWSAGALFVGSNGTNGIDGQDAPEVKLQYSDDGLSNWSYIYSITNKYMRFSTDGGTTWGSSLLFQGAGGGNGGFNFTQATASDTWVINHNLGYYPNVECFSAGGVYMFGSIQNLSINSVIVIFNQPVSGSARLV